MDPIDQMETHPDLRADGGAGPKTFPAARLERLLGKPSHAWTVEDLVRVYREQNLRLVALMHVGGDGWLKTLDFAPRSESHLFDVLSGGERADGSSLFPGSGIEVGKSDIVLRPRVGRAFLDPFAPLPTLSVLAAHAGRDGKPLPESPDTIVRHAARLLREEAGVDLFALGEVEYFLGKRPLDNDIYGANDRAYHAGSPFVFGEGLRREALGLLAATGVPVKYAHSEVGYIEARDTDDWIWEQHEIELGLAPLPEAAENVVLAQWVLRNLAHRKGWRCSFDPIMRKGHAGSGLHFHFSPVVRGEPCGGRGADGELSDPAKWLIAGLVKTGSALMAFGNRSAGSFVRLSQAKEAPNAVNWGEFDRSALVRLPIVARAEDDRMIAVPTIEFRLPDGSAHPYHLLAGVAQSMRAGRRLEGLDEILRRTSSARVDQDRKSLTPVPRSFEDVADAVAEHRAVLEDGGVFPARFIDRLIEQLRIT